MAAFAAQKDSSHGSVCLSTKTSLNIPSNTCVQLEPHRTISGAQQQVPYTISFPAENHIVVCIGQKLASVPWEFNWWVSEILCTKTHLGAWKT